MFAPKDTAIVTPNSDTPYSMVQMDLRVEPVVLCVPAIDKSRYYSVQLTVFIHLTTAISQARHRDRRRLL